MSRYWCTKCGYNLVVNETWGDRGSQFLHFPSTCDGNIIPVYRPLDVPEVTTWGESHPVGAVSSYFEVDDCPYQMIVSGRRFGCIDGDAAAVAGPKVCHDVADIVTAINYVAGAK